MQQHKTSKVPFFSLIFSTFIRFVCRVNKFIQKVIDRKFVKTNIEFFHQEQNF